jgi:hypothetical protein
MTDTSVLSRHYDALHPWERLPLICAASARGDEVEADRLVRSAPRLSWQLPDYYWLADGLREQAVQYLLEQLNAGSFFWEALHLLALKNQVTYDVPTSSLPSWLRLFAYTVVARAEGWRIFCAELPLDGHAFLRLLPGYAALGRLEEAAPAFAFSQEEAVAYLRDNARTDGDANPDHERKVSIDGPAQIAAAMREALEERLQFCR